MCLYSLPACLIIEVDPLLRIIDYAVNKVKMTDTKMLIHQDMLRRTKCALFCGLAASSPQRPLSTEQLCAVCFACLHTQYSRIRNVVN